MCWLRGDVVAQRRCGGSVEICWLRRDVVAQRRCVDSEKMWWLRGDVVAQRRCGGSREMWWLRGDVVAHIRRDGSWGDMEILLWCDGYWGDVVALRRCGSSDVVALRSEVFCKEMWWLIDVVTRLMSWLNEGAPRQRNQRTGFLASTTVGRRCVRVILLCKTSSLKLQNPGLKLRTFSILRTSLSRNAKWTRLPQWTWARCSARGAACDAESSHSCYTENKEKNYLFFYYFSYNTDKLREIKIIFWENIIKMNHIAKQMKIFFEFF